MTEGPPAPADAGLTHIDVSGLGTLGLLSITRMAPGLSGVLTTRLAALRVTVDWQRTPAETARIAVERFSADYLWHWLVAKARIEASS